MQKKALKKIGLDVKANSHNRYYKNYMESGKEICIADIGT